MFKLANLQAVMAVVVALLAAAKDLLPIPDVKDAPKFRTWLQAVVSVLKRLAALTGVRIDDEIVEVVDRILANDDTWAALYKVIINLITRDQTTLAAAPINSLGDPLGDACLELADKAELNPMLVIGIVQAAISLWKLINDLRK